MYSIENEVRELLHDFSEVTGKTRKNNKNLAEIDYFENPLNPNLLAYCFDVILGFNVRYRIAEKVNYVIEFSYKGTYAKVGHFKLSYNISIEERYKAEIIALLWHIKPLLERLFMSIGEQSLIDNEFSMKNEAPEYFAKLIFFQQKIETLENRKNIIREKCNGQYDVTKEEQGVTIYTPKGQAYLHQLHNEIIYDIESYVDTFFSALEHVLTLLYPFADTFSLSKSYYKTYIRNTKWSWDAKIRDVCGEVVPKELFVKLQQIKEVYRNHNAHGGFSREMMAYVDIPKFGRYPIYVGKEYLQGFVDGVADSVSYGMYMEAKSVFSVFWEMLDKNFEIPMMFARSGLPIPVETKRYTEGIKDAEQAQWTIEKMWFDIDNQSNMDW